MLHPERLLRSKTQMSGTYGHCRRSFVMGRLVSIWLPVVVMLALIGIWQAWTSIANVPEYMVPAPTVIIDRLMGDAFYFMGHGLVTLMEAFLGFSLGFLVAVCIATLMVHSMLLERTLYSLAVLLKVTPIVAIAPLFVIWFGFGALPKVFIAALITFFPVMVNVLIGFRSVNPNALDFFVSLNASKADIFLKLRVPSSLPYVFAAIRVALPLSIIGAVVGEWFTGDSGLGSVIIVAHNNLDMPTLFSAILVLAIIGLCLTSITAYVEKLVLFWHDSVITSIR